MYQLLPSLLTVLPTASLCYNLRNKIAIVTAQNGGPGARRFFTLH